MPSQVWTKIDFNARGMQSDFARVPYSSDTSAYGWIPVPMICFNGGEGPTALLIAGTHGDEYEGQIALRRIMRALAETEVKGRVIVLPALNQPAVVAGRRSSPLDGGNLNRLFPGEPGGGPTAMIAHYVTTELFPISDLVIDLHSGGRSLEYLPVALAHRGRTPDADRKIRALLDCFGAPHSIITDGTAGGSGTTLYAVAARNGVTAITTELGSGATLSKAGLDLAEAGLRRVLRRYGIAPDLDAPAATPTRLVRSVSREHSIYSPCDGLFEPLVGLGDRVTVGQQAGYVHRLDSPLTKPVKLTFSSAGLVDYRRFPTLAASGDVLFGLITDLEN